MDLDSLSNWIGIVDGTCNILGHLPKIIDKFQETINNNCSGVKSINNLGGYLNHKKNKEEKKLCNIILKKHNLPKSVGIMCKAKNDIYFIPNKTIIEKTFNNLYLKSNDGAAKLFIGGGFFAFNIELNESGFIHKKAMYGTVIKYKGEIYLLRHPLGGYPNYLARLELFINGMIIEFDDGLKIGLYY